MISQAAIRNFKCLRDVRVELERFTILVGPNASGKSSILQGLDLLCRAFHFPEEQIEDALTQAMSRGATTPVEVAVRAGESSWFRYRTRSSDTPGRPRSLGFKGSVNGRARAADKAGTEWKEWQPEPNRSPPLYLSVLLRLEASRLVRPDPAAPDPTVMAPNGTGLHSALASIVLNDPDAWPLLQADLRRVIPTIRRLRHTRAAPAALLFDTVGGDALLANQVSEGTLLVLGLLAALYAPDRPNLLLLDDLDRGLHPKAQKELIALLRGLLETHPDLQIVATTHSPYMVDCMQAHEVRMTILGEDGSTVCAALARHPEFERWKDEMAPGEMWSLFGEKWLVAQEAAS